MKIVIAGCGKIGSTMAKYLSLEDNELTLIDQNEKRLEALQESIDVGVIKGNCASMSVLKQAGVETADILIAATRADEVNLLTCITARFVNPDIHTIARIRNPEYSDTIFGMTKELAISQVINPERQAANEIAKLLELPGLMQRDSFARDRVEIVEVMVQKGSRLDGLQLSSIKSIFDKQILICAVLREGKVIIPSGDFILQKKDRAFVTAPTEVLSQFLAAIGLISKPAKRVLIAGGGMITEHLAKKLMASRVRLKILDNNQENCLLLAKELPDADIIYGDATNADTADREQYNKYDAIVTLTGQDEFNMAISLLASDRKVPTIITKISRLGTMDILDRLNIGSTVCPQELTGNIILRYVRAVKNQSGAAISVYNIANGMAEAAEFKVDETSRYRGIPLKDVPIRNEVLIAAILHEQLIEISNGLSSFDIGDTIIVVSNKSTPILSVNDIFTK